MEGGSVVESTLTVEIAIGDPKLAQRVRDMLLVRLDLVSAEDGQTPDVLITDSAEELADDLADALADATPVLVIGDASKAVDALRLGATGFLSPAVGAQVLHAALRAVALGLMTLPAGLRHVLVEEARDLRIEGEDETPAADLTARELQVLQLLAGGASNKVIAKRLGITPHTAKFHVAAIAGKLGATGRTDTVARAMRLGLFMV
jgi:DNA-binding NarL/FixJ family response regulator